MTSSKKVYVKKTHRSQRNRQQILIKNVSQVGLKIGTELEDMTMEN